MDKKNEVTLTILWAAMLASVVMFAIVGLISTGGFGQLGDLDYNQMFMLIEPFSAPFYLISIFAFIGHRLIPRLIRTQDPARATQMQLIIQCTMLETIALFGLLLAMLSKVYVVSIPFFVLSIIGFIGIHPSNKMQRPRPGTPIT